MNLSTKEGLGIIKVKTTVLLDKIKENRKNHQTELNDALVGFKTYAENLLKAELKRVKKFKEPKDIRFTKPQSHLEDYDQIIEMLVMSVDEEIEVTASQFRKYVMDKWDWTDHFKKLHTDYTSM